MCVCLPFDLLVVAAPLCQCVSRICVLDCWISFLSCHLTDAPASGGQDFSSGGCGYQYCPFEVHSVICSFSALPVEGVVSQCLQNQVTHRPCWAYKPHPQQFGPCCGIVEVGYWKDYSAQRQYQCWSQKNEMGLSSDSLQFRKERVHPEHQRGQILLPPSLECCAEELRQLCGESQSRTRRRQGTGFLDRSDRAPLHSQGSVCYVERDHLQRKTNWKCIRIFLQSQALFLIIFLLYIIILALGIHVLTFVHCCCCNFSHSPLYTAVSL